MNSLAKMIFSQSLVFEALKTGPQNVPLGYSEVTIDSRKVTEGALFVAIVGEVHDGHTFIEAAIKAGASGIVAQKKQKAKITVPDSVAVYWVEDTLEALRAIAQAWWLSHSLPSIVVAGSVGKTTTKEMLAALMRGRFSSVLKTRGSENGFLGIPLTLLRLRAEHGMAVIEVGIDDIGTMKRHMDYLKATAATVTAIAEEHLFQLKDIETVAREEGIALEETAKHGGVVVINLDDPHLKPFAQNLAKHDIVCVTLDPNFETNPHELAYRNLLKGELHREQLILNGLKFKDFAIPLPLPGKHNASNLLIAVALARSVGQLSDPEIIEGLKFFKEEFAEAYGRSDVQELRGSFVICDYYNANPASMRAAFSLLQTLAAEKGGRRWVCLGDMRELGPQEAQFHRDLAEDLMKAEVDQVLLTGELMKNLESELKSKGFEGQLRHFADQAPMAEVLRSEMKTNDVILIKASRGMALEKTWQKIRD